MTKRRSGKVEFAVARLNAFIDADPQRHGRY